MLHYGEVVRNEEVRQSALALQVGEQVQHLGLHRHVERADRLVQHEELWLDRERPGDPDALALAAGELVGIGRGERRIEPYLLEQRRDPPLGLGSGREPVNGEGLGEGLPHGHPGIEGTVRILEHDLHAAPQGPQLVSPEGHDVRPAERDPPRVRLDQPQDGAPDRRFPAPRLAHETKGLSRRNRERHAVHGMHRPTGAPQPEQPALAGETLDEAFDLDERSLRHA